MRLKRKNKIILIFLGIVVCFMAVAYAAFNTRLDITGISNISNAWDIEITNVTLKSENGKGKNVKAPTWDALTASMEANVYDSGDSVSYDVTISNLGTLDATLDSITKNIESNNNAVKIECSGYIKGETLYKHGETGSTKTITVTILFNNNYQGELDYSTSTQTNITFNYKQATSSGPISNNHLVTYDCTTNGGTDCSDYNEYIEEGNSIDLTKEGTKEGYRFVGWNTEASASTALSSLTMENEDITLYAIWTKDIYTITFNPSDGTVSPTTKEVVKGKKIGQLPTPTKSNYVFGGWYTSQDEEIDENYIPESDIELTAMWFESDIVAVMDKEGYKTLSSAITEVPTNNTKKTIKLLKDVTESNTIAKNKNIVLNLNGHKVNQTSANKVFTNNGTLEITNGNLAMTGTTNVIDNNSVMKIKDCNITSSASSGAVNNNEGGNLEVINTRIEMTGARQAIYNDGGILKITGTSYLSNVKDRAALHNLNNGIATVESGTIISTSKIGAIYNQAGTVTLGIKDGTISDKKPVVQGTTYAIAAEGNINFYDGILKGGTSVIDIPDKIVEIEEDSESVNDIEDIDGVTYHTLYLRALGERFKVTLDPNGGEVMPTSLRVAGGEEIGQIPTPTRHLYNFIGWYTETSGGTKVTDSYVVESDITIHARWEKKQTYIITFEENGGSNVEDREIEQGNEIGELPTPTKEGFILEGWYLEDDYQTKVTESYVPIQNKKLYAKWITTTFPKVFEQTGECIFNGSNSNITGSECQDYADKKYIDTGIALYSSENINKDYEIGFEIVNYVPGNNVNQATFFNTKLETTGYPGLVFRKKTNTDVELASRKTSSTNQITAFTAANITTFKIYRIAGKIYYSTNNEEKILSNDLTQYNPTFNLTAWFGAAPSNADGTTAQRHFVGTLKNMYIKLGTYEETDNSSLEVSTAKTTSSITVVASATPTSEITKYEFSNDDGETWINNGTNNTYQFTNLTHNTIYPIKARVTFANNKTKTRSVNVKTSAIDAPTYSQSGEDVTITYPSGCGSTYTCSYIKDSENPVTVTSTTETVNFKSNGTLVATVSDGNNEVSSSFIVN
ncbi:MAG: InlB B-repeat-containing protein [Bacilli bacterium]|nr:InlB B-repeat-containing protein [Bacilli bacterium]